MLLDECCSAPQATAVYCAICGNTQLEFGDYCVVCGCRLNPSASSHKTQGGRDMHYKSIRVNENGKALVCPHCDNEELTQGDYCMICGNNIVNRCADTPDPNETGVMIKSCRTILPGNARYCPKCGNESTFFQKGWLRDWRSENTRRAIENVNMAVDFAEIQNEKSTG